MVKIGVYIGRFQPLHNGHVNIINEMLKTEDIVLIIIGSKFKCDTRNIFSYNTRKRFITETFKSQKILVDGLYDYEDDEVWCHALDSILRKNINCKTSIVTLHYSAKDNATEEYIRLIMQKSNIIKYVMSHAITQHSGKNIDATDIRNYIINNMDIINNLLPQAVLDIINDQELMKHI